MQPNTPQSAFQFENLRDPTNDNRLRQSAVTLPQAKRPRNNSQSTAEEILNGLFGTLILFSLFDGGGIARKICERLHIRPTAVVAAEEMIQLRAAVAEQYGYTAEPGAWSYDKDGIPSTYLTDVWELFKEKDGTPSFVLQQALSFAEQAQHKYLIIGGSPCTDLTSASVHGGALGFCGKESFHYHVYPFLISAIQALDPQAQIFVLFENAASMKPIHTTYMHSVVKMPRATVKEIDTQKFSDPNVSVRRNRFILTSSSAIGSFIEPDSIRFENGFRRHPLATDRRIPPIMRPRGVSERGQPRYSDTYYAVSNLLFCDERCADERVLQMNQQLVQPDGIPILPVDISDVLSESNVALWNTLQQWIVDKQKAAWLNVNPNSKFLPVRGVINPEGKLTYHCHTETDQFGQPTTLGQFNDHDVVTSVGNGSPDDRGTGRTSIAVKVKRTAGQLSCRIFLDQVMPFGISPVEIAKIDTHGFPDNALSSNFSIMLEALADVEHSAPFRILNAREREQLTGYDQAFDDLDLKDKYVNNLVSAVMTGNAFHPKTIMLAASGNKAGTLTEFAQGKIQFGQTSRLVPLNRIYVEDVIKRYKTYSEGVRKSLQGTKFSNYVINPSPFPIGKDDEIRSIQCMQAPTNFPIPVMQPRHSFRYNPIMNFGKKVAYAPPEGIKFVLPQSKSQRVFRRLTGKALDVVSKRPAAHQIDLNKIFFVAPCTATSTQKAILNICRAITTAVHGEEGPQANAELEVFYALCKSNGLQGGGGLYYATPESKTQENKTAAPQSMKLAFAIVAEYIDFS